MSRELLIDDAPGYLRAAVVEDGRLCEIHSEKSGSAGETERAWEQETGFGGAALYDVYG